MDEAAFIDTRRLEYSESTKSNSHEQYYSSPFHARTGKSGNMERNRQCTKKQRIQKDRASVGALWSTHTAWTDCDQMQKVETVDIMKTRRTGVTRCANVGYVEMAWPHLGILVLREEGLNGR
jgi:hypothetical protein